MTCLIDVKKYLHYLSWVFNYFLVILMAYRAGSQDLTSSEDDSDKDWDKSPKSKKRRMSKVLEDTIAANDDDMSVWINYNY